MNYELPLQTVSICLLIKSVFQGKDSVVHINEQNPTAILLYLFIVSKAHWR